MITAGLYGPLPGQDYHELEVPFRSIALRTKYFAREISENRVAFVNTDVAKQWLAEIKKYLESEVGFLEGYDEITDDGLFLRHGSSIIDIEMK